MRQFKQYGKPGWHHYSVRFADGRQEGVATCAYNYGMSQDEKVAMARRITAALNATAHLSVEQIEALAAGDLASASERMDELEGLRNFHDFFRGHCNALLFHFGKAAIDRFNEAAESRPGPGSTTRSATPTGIDCHGHV